MLCLPLLCCRASDYALYLLCSSRQLLPLEVQASGDRLLEHYRSLMRSAIQQQAASAMQVRLSGSQALVPDCHMCAWHATAAACSHCIALMVAGL